jgi:hypothetical protein
MKFNNHTEQKKSTKKIKNLKILHTKCFKIDKPNICLETKIAVSFGEERKGRLGRGEGSFRVLASFYI